jgi:hypothetical protein
MFGARNTVRESDLIHSLLQLHQHCSGYDADEKDAHILKKAPTIQNYFDLWQRDFGQPVRYRRCHRHSLWAKVF